MLSSGFVDTDEEAEENCQALAKSLQKVRVCEREFDGSHTVSSMLVDFCVENTPH